MTVNNLFGLVVYPANDVSLAVFLPPPQIRILDPFTVKPLDWEAVQRHAAACGGRVVTVEDHYPEVGRGYLSC